MMRQRTSQKKPAIYHAEMSDFPPSTLIQCRPKREINTEKKNTKNGMRNLSRVIHRTLTRLASTVEYSVTNFSF